MPEFGVEEAPVGDQSAPPPQTASAASPAPSSYETLSLQDSVTSNWIITFLASEPQFEAFAKSETESILARDAEDDEKLAGGIKIAVEL